MPDADAVVKTLTQLIVRPLHQVEVGAANGWREGGWHELHGLAFDSAKDPYYLILYSNTSNGYVVDLKRAQIYTADFGGRVDNPQSPGTLIRFPSERSNRFPVRTIPISIPSK